MYLYVPFFVWFGLNLNLVATLFAREIRDMPEMGEHGDLNQPQKQQVMNGGRGLLTNRKMASDQKKYHGQSSGQEVTYTLPMGGRGDL